MKKLFAYFLAFVVMAGNAGIFINDAQAASASLFLSPKTGTYKVGKKFTVTVALNSGGGTGVNAAEGVIKYDPSLVLATAISYGSSIFELWTTKPKYSNTSGEIIFAGGAPDAYKGSAGTIFTVTFNVLKKGTANLTFTSGLALAADGKGTNILSGFGNGTYTLEEETAPKEDPKVEPKKTEPEVKKPTETTPVTTTKKEPKAEEKKDASKLILPPTPKVTSPTHPEEAKWYPHQSPVFEWKLLSDIQGISYDLNKETKVDPGNTSDGIGESKKFDNYKDGIWYFHIKYQNKNGWGEITHRKAMIDVTPPEAYKIMEDTGGDPTNPAPAFRFMTVDKTSGMDMYKVSVDGTEQVISAQSFSGLYTSPVLLPGEHSVSVAALDKAGNIASTSMKFFVEPLKPPVITEIPKTITDKQLLVVRGSSFYSDVKIKIFIGTEGKPGAEFEAQTDSQGNWSYFHNKTLNKGNYDVWAKIVDKRGAESSPTGKYYLSVLRPTILEAYGFWIILVLAIITVLLLIYIFYQSYRHKSEIARIKRETLEVKSSLSKVFLALREEVEELIEYADKKPGVTESEKRVRDKLKEALDISEEFMAKEVEDIEKEIK